MGFSIARRSPVISGKVSVGRRLWDPREGRLGLGVSPAARRCRRRLSFAPDVADPLVGDRGVTTVVLNLLQLAPDRFIHEPAGLDRDHPRAISGADVGFQIGFHFNAPSFERGAPHAALAHRGAINIGSASP